MAMDIDNNLNVVKSMILDEEKLITYVSLSKDLCIHVNNSKLLLRLAVENIQKDMPGVNLNVNYIVSGTTSENKCRTTLCSETDLGNLKKSLIIIFYEHIYSVSKGPSTVDTAAYVAISTFEDFVLCTGIIKNDKCMKRAANDITNSKSHHESVTDTKLIISNQNKIKQEKVSVKNGNESGTVKVSTSESKVKIEEIPPQKIVDNKQKPNKVNGHKAQKGIAGFFNKTNGIEIKKEFKINEQDNQLKQTSDVKVEKMDTDDVTQAVENSIKENGKEIKLKAENKIIQQKMVTHDVTQAVENSIKENGKKITLTDENKILHQIKKQSKVDKKRKRVLHVSDSESDDENENNESHLIEKSDKLESDDEIPPTPTTNSVKITSGIVNPKKRRKIVDKTYMDEDGYILTKKEEIYESGSENENVQEAEKEPIKIVQKETKKVEQTTNKSKKKISPQKGKQATMMNFFKKV